METKETVSAGVVLPLLPPEKCPRTLRFGCSGFVFCVPNSLRYMYIYNGLWES